MVEFLRSLVQSAALLWILISSWMLSTSTDNPPPGCSFPQTLRNTEWPWKILSSGKNTVYFLSGRKWLEHIETQCTQQGPKRARWGGSGKTTTWDNEQGTRALYQRQGRAAIRGAGGLVLYTTRTTTTTTTMMTAWLKETAHPAKARGLKCRFKESAHRKAAIVFRPESWKGQHNPSLAKLKQTEHKAKNWGGVGSDVAIFSRIVKFSIPGRLIGDSFLPPQWPLKAATGNCSVGLS